jgi:hypothetical protein
MKAVAVLWMWSTVVVGLLAGALESAIARDTGGRLLKESLDSVLGPRKSIIPMSNPANKSWVNTIPHIRDLPITKIRMRCDQYLACGNSTPTIEISNAIIHQKVVYFNYPDQESLDIIEKFPTFFADVPNRLPSCSGKVPTAEAWLPGPRFSVINATHRPPDAPKRCGEYVDTSAHFLYAWEHSNVFHALNDNLFKVLVSLIIQRYTQTGPDEILTNRATLYVFDVSVAAALTAVLNILLLTFIMLPGECFTRFCYLQVSLPSI